MTTLKNKFLHYGRAIYAYALGHKILSVIALILVLWGGAKIFGGGAAPVETVTVKRGTITEEVSITGKTKAVDDLQLAFQSGGRVARANVAVGDTVRVGQVLAELDTSELAASLEQARANVQAQEAKLAELRRGTRPEDLQIKQTELRKAEQDLANAYANVFDTLNDAYTKADDAVRKQLDDLFANDEDSTPQLTFQAADSAVKSATENRRAAATSALRSWKKELDALSSITITAGTQIPVLTQDLANARKYLLIVRDLLNSAMDAVTGSSNLSVATLATYKTNITTARTNIGVALTNVNAQSQSISSAEITVSRLKDELNLKLAGTPAEQVSAQEAQVRQAEAQVQVLLAQMAKSIIRSPINGLITRQEAKPGEIAAANTALISVISQGRLDIEANITEADVAKIKIGNTARITFDAFGESVKFSGRISFIDPAETVIDGVPTYKTTLQLNEENPAIKPGLTANIDILANEHGDVLVIPQRAIGYRGDTKFVLMYRDDKTKEERIISTGLRGTDGNIEILSGLSEGERILPTAE